MKKIIFLFLVFISISDLRAQEVKSIEKIATQLRFVLEIGAGESLESSVDVYKVIYTTIDLEGWLTEASGTLYIPTDVDEVQGAIVYGHGTANGRYEVPSYGNQEQLIPSIMAAKGYIAVCADYLGLGDNPGLHPYVHADSEAWTNRDLLLAVREYMESSESIFELEFSSDLYITGYSQGGHAAMALHKYLETEDDHGFQVKLSVPMSGPYSIEYIYNSILDIEKQYDYVAYVAWVILSYQKVYGNIYENLDDFFVPELTPAILSYVEGSSDLDNLNSVLTGYLLENYGGAYAARIIQPNILTELINNPDNNLAKAAKDNNVYDWSPQAKTRLLYCEADDQVPFENSILAEQTMNSNFALDVEAIHINPDLNHVECVLPAVRRFLSLLDETVTTVSNINLVNMLYPNPTSGRLYIKGDDIEQVEVYNSMGLLLHTIHDFNDEIDMSRFASGLYILRVTDSKSQSQVTKVMVN